MFSSNSTYSITPDLPWCFQAIKACYATLYPRCSSLGQQ